jgi:hypothetical protein
MLIHAWTERQREPGHSNVPSSMLPLVWPPAYGAVPPDGPGVALRPTLRPGQIPLRATRAAATQQIRRNPLLPVRPYVNYRARNRGDRDTTVLRRAQAARRPRVSARRRR